MHKRVIVITGPTATGKTALSVELALRLGGEVVSADSMQLYRRMDIGTAKVSPSETRGVPHHMVDVAEPEENFSVSRWVDMAAECCEDILARGKVPIITGGTGLYIDSLLSGRDFAAAPDTDEALRQRLSEEYDSIGGEAFREKLREVDPERAEKLHAADKKRLTRAMEVYLLTGETITAHDERTRAIPPRYESLRLALTYENRDTLYERIDRRVDIMVEAGLFEEVESLLHSGLSEGCTAMQAIGYKEPAAFFAGKCSREEAIDKIKQESRRYAKRQLTWLRRDSGLHWILRDGVPDAESHAEEVLRLWEAMG
ncbi:MAG: tRNA (adenosine(37)-N6)-dimethylallyltransferase MiaA [Oscillospiraceae bacterium]|nr:tRNA (adenosine(37)-N6)-dimethylallyltransferase MiaA [Oscillospiraceae bacterium]